jgi:hypothetical protein
MKFVYNEKGGATIYVTNYNLSTVVGGTISINGVVYNVDEVIPYVESDDAWTEITVSKKENMLTETTDTVKKKKSKK